MAELGELERNHAEFDRRDTRIVVISVEGTEDAKKTQAAFPHLIVVSDVRRGLSSAAGVLPVAAPPGGGIASPTTLLLDRLGTVRWAYRYFGPLSPNEMLAAINEHLAVGR
jgi:peroxiredoxin